MDLQQFLLIDIYMNLELTVGLSNFQVALFILSSLQELSDPLVLPITKRLDLK